MKPEKLEKSRYVVDETSIVLSPGFDDLIGKINEIIDYLPEKPEKPFTETAEIWYHNEKPETEESEEWLKPTITPCDNDVLIVGHSQSNQS